MLEEEALLGKIALKRGILEREQLKECLRLRRRGGKVRPLVAVLVEQGYVTDRELAVILADQRRYLQKRQRSKRIQKKLRESQAGTALLEESIEDVEIESPAPAEPERLTARVRDESVEIDRCRYCGKPIQGSALRCQHCGKKQYRGGEEDRIDRRRARSEYLCNICFYPVFEEENECPSCHAVFLRPGEGGEFKCSQCRRFVGDDDEVCPWCQAEFT